MNSAWKQSCNTHQLYDQSCYNTVPPEALQVRAMSDDSAVLGQSYSMNCLGHKDSSGLANLPSPQWLTSQGSSITGAQLQGPSSVGTSSSQVVATFSTLRTSHAGNYICRASLSSQALTSPIIKSISFGITVQRK